MYTVAGQLISTTSLEGQQGSNDWQLPATRGIAKGIYIIEVADIRGLILEKISSSFFCHFRFKNAPVPCLNVPFSTVCNFFKKVFLRRLHIRPI